MKIRAIEQLPLETARTGYDMVIAASGYESRARFVAEALGTLSAPLTSKLVFSFAEHKDKCARPENDTAFKNLGYKPVLCRGGSDEEVIESLTVALGELMDVKGARLLVDISSMTRVWYGAVVRALIAFPHRTSLIVDFSYAAAEFVTPPSEYPSNRVVAPVAGFTGNTLPDKPTALILGLGYDKDRAIGLKDHLDPQLTILFYADPANDKRYVPEVLTVNQGLIDEVGDDCLFTYPFPDCATTFHLVESVCKGLTHEWRVVLCSLGPKIFGLSCFLVASLVTDVSIWRVSAESHERPFDHKAVGTPMLLRTTWK